MKKLKKNKLKGMSFVEAIVGIFIFSVVMLAVTMIFTSSFDGYKKAEKMAKNIEDAQFAMNWVAKSLRTSKVLGCNDLTCDVATPSSTIIVRFFDYSQNLCGRLEFSGGKLWKSELVNTGNQPMNTFIATCTTAPIASFTTQSLTEGYVEGSFAIVKSFADSNPSNSRIGKVTIKMKVCSEANCAGAKNDSVVLQTTVSLRDYSTVGL